MGYTYEIYVWDHAVDNNHYYWLEIYRGQSFITAIYKMWWCRKQGWKCIKLEYRP